jgi:fibronectin type 3 domain-containing protein
MKLRLLIFHVAATAVLSSCAGISTSTHPPTGAYSGGGTSSTHNIDLSWAASTSSDIAGYNVYRTAYNNSCGSFSRINSSLVTTTWYTDSEVTNGSSYCYATTAVNTSNQESSFSNVVSNVEIPVP